MPDTQLSRRQILDQEGYLLVPNAIDADLIDELVAIYQRDIVPSQGMFSRQSAKHAYTKNEVTSHGYVTDSFLDVHAYYSHPEFREQALKILFSEALVRLCTEIAAEPCNLMQSMFFDMNTATCPHQDYWYLDSTPPGQLFAVWIALEDIQEEAGRFFVIPRSNQIELYEPGLTHDDYLVRCKELFDSGREQVVAPALKKGDIIFWNSKLVHGALETSDTSLSRKSLTAHFLPQSLGFGNIFTDKEWIDYSDWNGHKWFANQPEYSRIEDVKARIKKAIYSRPQAMRIARFVQKNLLRGIMK